MNPGPIYLDVLPPIEIPAGGGEETVDELQKTWEREVRAALGQPAPQPAGQPA
ncbi:MAG: hypothetical protein FJZ00_09715 [Candidatus Sericytochromatia bacterium]|uniref:Uncharacterized protein n=1 Tax=Candidatus Tanganyikabacteria bacterium TaxID=2961651 RepID=A0A938BNR3_9BACT|nr:hypothetical protein [Candidatus Tanganyikabacteria bacterium]